MLRDVATIVWKDLNEWLGESGKRSRMTLLIFAVIFGVVMPLQWGRDWITSPLSLLSIVGLPFLLVSSTIADAIAGERERHTLETLLSTRITDSALFTGKIAASVLYAVCQLWVIGLLGVATINVAYWNGSFAFYSIGMTIAFLVMPLLIAGLAAGIGMLVSMRAPTARAAQQSLTVALFVLVLPLFALGIVPDSVKSWIDTLVAGIDLTLIPIVVGGVLLALDTALLAVARARFGRGRLTV